jgi:hypothetical protein
LGVESFLQQLLNPNLDSLLSAFQQGDDTPGDDVDAEYENIFHIKVPPKLSWKENLTLDLHKEEAEFFRDRIVSISKNKLIAKLLQNDKLWGTFLQSNNFMQFSKAAVNSPISDNLKTVLTLAHDFSELMFGAHLAYNCQLHHKVFNSNHYDQEWQEWTDRIQDNMLDYSNFNPEDLFAFATTTKATTMQFVKNWWIQTQNNFPDLKTRDFLIENQESIVKGSKARLHWKKTDDVKENKWLGLQHFEYRFSQARIILNDIKTAITN